ncbi:MAG TPA: NAD(P)-dependent oxidoreductase [Burkholderiales bacterium]|nr:NAD(P)-dependent oxidoreductase [Burkholderiales bacterium]
MKVGFLGLGKMGRAMALRLVEAGHSLAVFNRTAAAASAFEGRARLAAHPAETLDSDVVITMLADDAAVEAVWAGLTLPPSAIHLNMATVSVGLARRFSERQKSYVAAPVFGRPAAAAKGELDIIAAGAPQPLERCRPLFAVLGKQLFVVGEQPAQANAVKIARNFLLSTVIEGLGEAVALARGSGVSAETFVEVITRTSLAAPAYKSYGKLMVERSYEPAQFDMTLGLKDVELALATAREHGVPLPTAELVRANLLNAIQAGHAHKDWAALAEYLKKSG